MKTEKKRDGRFKARKVVRTEVATGAEEELGTVDQVAEKLFYEPNTVRHWIQDGQVHNGYTYKWGGVAI